MYCQHRGQNKALEYTSASALKDIDAHAPFNLNFLSSSAKVLNYLKDSNSFFYYQATFLYNYTQLSDTYRTLTRKQPHY